MAVAYQERHDNPRPYTMQVAKTEAILVESNDT